MHLFPVLALGTEVVSPAEPAGDPHSYAQPDKVVVTHIDLNLAIDFAHRKLTGSVTMALDWKDAQATQLVLDTDQLAIASIAVLDENDHAQALDYTFAERVAHMGSKLTIEAPKHPAKVRIAYTTAPTAAGLQWLSPEQTADKHQPFMFSQSESVYARSWIPLQDSPAIRFSYAARITAPEGLRVVMSALTDAKQPLDGAFDFEQPHPIPSYLMAIAAGKLAVAETGARSAVYAEPSIVAKAAKEFEDTEKMIDAAEKLYGPYRWGRYDILVLPPSFPYGGMENPDMTFATPTVLVGDKSLVSLVAHELAHSWSGNLVTAASWRDIWLNEGVTTYVQGRITEALYGKRQATEEALLAIHRLQREIGNKPANAQRLAPEPDDATADDSLSEVAYDKGSWFLRFLENRFGRERFDAWLKSYVSHFAWHSITTEQMLVHLKTHLIDKHPGIVDWDEVNEWIYGTGLPDDAPIPDCPRFDAIDQQRSAFLAGELSADKIAATDWNTQEWMYFLDALPEKTPLDRIRALDAAWHLTGTPNAEIGMRWYRRAIGAGDEAAWPYAAEHMTRIGRLYLTMPLYKAFAKSPAGLDYAEQVYRAAKAGYHPLTQHAVEAVFAKAHKALPQPSSSRPQPNAEPG